jgi:hypothetical protein
MKGIVYGRRTEIPTRFAGPRVNVEDVPRLPTTPARWLLDDPRCRPYFSFWQKDRGTAHDIAYAARMERSNRVDMSRQLCEVLRGSGHPAACGPALSEASRPASHVLRLLIQAGEPLTYVQQQLGHHSAAFTLTVYGHFIPRADHRPVDTLDDVTGRNPDATTAEVDAVTMQARR